MMCAYECHQIGGPWIAENPDCPIHGINGIGDDLERVDDMRDIIRQLCDALERHVTGNDHGSAELVERGRSFL